MFAACFDEFALFRENPVCGRIRFCDGLHFKNRSERDLQCFLIEALNLRKSRTASESND